MLNFTDRAPASGVDHRTDMLEPLHRPFDLSDYQVVQEIPVFVQSRPTSYHRALQALRDIRHMLPKRGIAIVDAVLDQAE